jgi:non-specific serine/threonine protein kinase/serine/threonine-protein kinase
VQGAKGLTGYVQQHPLSTRQRLELFAKVCDAVHHAHQKGVIHRDLKPANILIDSAGQPKIIDFGVARSTDADAALTTMHTDIGQLLGTLRYMCPEQFDGTSDDVDVRADVYALGVVLYELLAGRSPYDTAGKAVHQVARVVREVEPRALASVDRTFRGDLDTIVSKCLEKDRTRRYSSAVELEADLGRYLQGQPIAAEAPGLIGSLARVARRHRLAAASAVAVATAVALGVAATGIFAIRAERSRIREVDARERADAARLEAIDNAEQSQIGVKLEGNRPEAGHTARQDSRSLGIGDGSHDQAHRCDASAARHRFEAACEIGDGSPPADRIRRDLGKLFVVVLEHVRLLGSVAMVAEAPSR